MCPVYGSSFVLEGMGGHGGSGDGFFGQQILVNSLLSARPVEGSSSNQFRVGSAHEDMNTTVPSSLSNDDGLNNNKGERVIGEEAVRNWLSQCCMPEPGRWDCSTEIRIMA